MYGTLLGIPLILTDVAHPGVPALLYVEVGVEVAELDEFFLDDRGFHGVEGKQEGKLIQHSVQLAKVGLQQL